MTKYFVEHKEHLDSPKDAVFGFVEVDANGAQVEDTEVTDAEEETDHGEEEMHHGEEEMGHGEQEIDDPDADLDLASEPSPLFVPDSAFFIKGNPVLIAQTATRIPEAVVQTPKAAVNVPKVPARIVRQEIEVPTSKDGTAAPGKRVCKDMDARGLLTTYEIAPVSFKGRFGVKRY